MADKKAIEERPGYSTLEVHNNPVNWTHSRAEAQVAYDGENLPEATAQPRPLIPMQPDLPKVEETRRIWEVKKRAFVLTILLVGLILIGVGVGAGVGATRSRGGATPDNSVEGDGQDKVPYNSPVLASSNLAAANWTDRYGNPIRAVLWQAQTGSLMMSVKGPSDWTVTDIGASAEQAPPNLKFDAQSGTSIAAVAYSGDPFRIVVAYTNPTGYVRAMGTGDVTGRGAWWYEDLTLARNAPITSPDSQLAVLWSPDAGEGNAHLYLQNQQQRLNTLLKRNYFAGPRIIEKPMPRPGSGLAVVPFSTDWTFDQLAMFFDDSGTLTHAVLDWSSDFGWNSTSQ